MKISEINSAKDLEGLSNTDLRALHDKVHDLDEVLLDKGVAREYRTVHQHIYVVEAMVSRGLKHRPEDRLDRDAAALSAAAVSEDTTSRGVMLCLRPSLDVAEQLAVPAGIPADEIHLTLVYLGKISEDIDDEQAGRAAEVAAQVASQFPILTGGVGGLGSFPEGEDGVPWWVPVDVRMLEHLRTALVSGLDEAEVPYRKDHGFAPHITLTYLDPGQKPPESVPPTDISFERLTLEVGPDQTHYPFLGQGMVAAGVPDWLSSKITGADPEILVPGYVSVVGSAVDATEPNDIDILIRDHPDAVDEGWRESVMLLVRNLFSTDGDKRQVHVLVNPTGPHISQGRGYVPTHDLVLSPRAPEVVSRSVTAALKPGQSYRMTKPLMLGYVDFSSLDEMWEKWGKEALEQSGALYVSPKIDGYRLSASRNKEKVGLHSEDHKRDFASLDQMSALVDDLDAEVIIEGELVAVVGRKYLARPQIATFLAGKLKAKPKVYLYDILYDDEDLHDLPWSQRHPRLQQVARKLGRSYVLLPQQKATSHREFVAAARKAAAWQGGPAVEGVVVRKADMPYKMGPDSSYAKMKVSAEIKFRVLGVNKVSNGYTYRIGLRNPPRGLSGSDIVEVSGRTYLDVGKTFVSKTSLAKVGDTLNVSVEELILEPDGRVATGKPTPQGPDRSRPAYTVKQAVNLARRFGVLKEHVTASGQMDARLVVVGAHWGGSFLQDPGYETVVAALSKSGIDPHTDAYWINLCDGFDDLDPEAMQSAAHERIASLPDARSILMLGSAATRILTGSSATNADDRESVFEVAGLPAYATHYAFDSSSSFDLVADAIAAGKTAGLLDEGSIVGAALPQESTTRAEAAKLNWQRSWQEAMPLGGKPQPYILHCHIMGLSEEESGMSLEDLLDSDRRLSMHFDLRLGTDQFNGWFGVTIFGPTANSNREEFELLNKAAKQSDIKMQSTIKSYGPSDWMKVGVKDPFVSGPKGVGSGSKSYAKFFAIDTGTWQLGYARLHSVEMFLKGDLLKGRYLFGYAPLGGSRKWLFYRPEDQQSYTESHNVAKVLSDLKSKKQQWLVWPKDPKRLGKGHDLVDVRKESVKRYRIAAGDLEARFTWGVVYAPEERDSWGFRADPKVVRQMAWDYMLESRQVGVMHIDGTQGRGVVVECGIYRGPAREVNGEIVKPGSWIMGALWPDDETWDHIRNRRLKGWSQEGWGWSVDDTEHHETVAASAATADSSGIVGAAFDIEFG